MKAELTRFVERSVSVAKETVVGRPAPPVQKGEGGYATWLVMAVQCYKEREGETYRSVVDKLKTNETIRSILDLGRSELPHPSTLAKAADRVPMRWCRRFLKLSARIHDTGETAAIDASGFDRIAASSRYRRQTDYQLESLKTTLLVDCSSGAILDLDCATSRPHDTRVAGPLLDRNYEWFSVLTADKGYDASKLRRRLRSNNVRPLIKHREFDSLDEAHNARLDEDLYNRRQVVEAVFRVLGQRYGDRLTARKWYQQYQEVTLKCAAKNIDDTIEPCYG